MSGACSTFATGWPGIAVLPGLAQSPIGDTIKQCDVGDVWNRICHIVKTILKRSAEC